MITIANKLFSVRILHQNHTDRSDSPRVNTHHVLHWRVPQSIGFDLPRILVSIVFGQVKTSRGAFCHV